MPLLAVDFATVGAAVALALLGLITAGVVVSYFSGVVPTVNRHLGRPWNRATVLTRPVLNWERVNLFLALEALRAETPDARPVIGLGYFNELTPALSANASRNTPLEFTVRPTSLLGTTKVVAAGLYLLRPPGLPPFGAMLSRTALDVIAPTAEEAQRALDRVLAEARARNVFRGQVLVVEQAGFAGPNAEPDFQIHFHDLPKVGREQIILPDEVLKVVERNVIGLLTHAETLRKAGRSTRHGVLFHGPPGVGKTLVTKYLARACPDYTVILLTGRQLKLVRESCVLARLLQPALVVIEDVDLIAVDREQSLDTTLLHDLMDEMDGLGTKANVIFLLTTNRPRMLEKALAARPGRVDQAVYFPLPDRDCRRRLFEHFTRGLDLSGVDADPLLDRTEGASPAFIEELFRKAALMAAERGERTDPLKLTTADFEAAVRELVEFGGALTQHLLGYRNDPDAGSRGMGFDPG
ncbi:MAG: cell division protein FtsH [Gemmataceae bacterium]|nr:cell division protein FtsH [Gemmataceae bacterium]